MELKTFLSRVLDSDGFYCVIGLSQDKAVQKFYNSIDQVVETARNLNNNNYNVSFGLATFETADSRKVPNIKVKLLLHCSCSVRTQVYQNLL